MHSLTNDTAHLVSSFFDNRNTFFSFSSSCRRIHHFFKEERKKIIQQGKIQLIKDMTFFFTIEGEVYACGSNSNNQLGLGKEWKITEWTKIGPPHQEVLRIVPGLVNTYAFSREGLYACGNNSAGQMGLGDKTYPDGKWRVAQTVDWIPIGPRHKKIKTVRPMNLTTLLECEEGWYAAGKNFAGALNKKEEFFNNEFNWKRIGPVNKTVFGLIAANDTLFVQCEDGWYGKGDNSYGQLGKNEERRVQEWERIGPQGETVLEIVADGFKTFVRCVTGWFACGQNDKNYLGVEENFQEVCRYWVKVEIPGKTILKIICGGMFCPVFIQCEDGWYVVGGSSIITPLPEYYRNTPRGKNWVKLVLDDEEILDVEIIRNNTYLQCKKGWYIFSNKPKGNLGIKAHEIKTWVKLGPPGKKVFRCEYTVKNTFVLCEDGWYACGENKSGQLATGDTRWRQEWVKVVLPNSESSEEIKNSSKIGFG